MEPDLTSPVKPYLHRRLLSPKKQTIDLQRLVHLAGPAFSDDQSVGRVLRLHYSRLADKRLQL